MTGKEQQQQYKEHEGREKVTMRKGEGERRKKVFTILSDLWRIIISEEKVMVVVVVYSPCHRHFFVLRHQSTSQLNRVRRRKEKE